MDLSSVSIPDTGMVSGNRQGEGTGPCAVTDTPPRASPDTDGTAKSGDGCTEKRLFCTGFGVSGTGKT